MYLFAPFLDIPKHITSKPVVDNEVKEFTINMKNNSQHQIKFACTKFL